MIKPFANQSLVLANVCKHTIKLNPCWFFQHLMCATTASPTNRVASHIQWDSTWWQARSYGCIQPVIKTGGVHQVGHDFQIHQGSVAFDAHGGFFANRPPGRVIAHQFLRRKLLQLMKIA